MKSVGEAMAIGRTFAESLQKALRSLETGLTGFDEIALSDDKTAIRAALARATPDRLRIAAQAMRHGFPAGRNRSTSPDTIPGSSGEIEAIIATEARSARKRLAEGRRRPSPPQVHGLFRCAPGQADRHEGKRRARRRGTRWMCAPCFKRIDTCAAEFAALTPYMYSTYETPVGGTAECESRAHRQEEDHHPGRRTQPHRPGHRVRLLLLPRRLLAVGAGLSRPSWSTAIRKPSRPITTPPTGSISNR